MTKALTATGTISAAPPALSGDLAHQVTRYFSGEDMRLNEIDRGEIAAARAALPAARACCAPASVGDVRAWMEVVAISVGRNAPEELARNAMITMVVETCGDLPAGCWTPASRVQFARTRGAKAAFFPTDGEVDAILRPIARMMRVTVRALEAIVAEGDRRLKPAPKLALEDTPVSALAGEARDKAIAHVTAATRDWMRSRVPAIVETAEMARKPSHLRGEALWEERNRARAASGMPLLPRPASFVGYGS